MKIHSLKRAIIISSLAFVISCAKSPSDSAVQIETPRVSSQLITRPATPGISQSPQSTLGTQKGQRAQFAFVSDRRKRYNLDVWLFDLETKQMESITDDDWQDMQPKWSPDGQTLAFISFLRSESNGILRAVDLTNRVPRILVSPSEPDTAILDFTWSGDGRSIFYTTYSYRTSKNDIWWFDVQTLNRHHITTGFSPLAVSADSQYLAFADQNPDSRGRFDTSMLRVLRLADMKDLTFSHQYLNPGGLMWSPIGDTLAVVYGLGFRQITTYVVDGEQTKLRAQDSGVPGSSWEGSLCDPVWSHDAQEISVVRSSVVANVCHGEVWLYDAGLNHSSVFLADGLINYARWSRDGKQIIYARNDTLNVIQFRADMLGLLEGEIWVTESTGLLSHPLIKDAFYNGQPAWRP